MAYNIVTVDKSYEVESTKIDNLHIGTLYGGLKNSLGQVTGNLKYATLSSVLNSEGWCTITLSKVDDTACKVLASCTENTLTSNRECKIQLKYNTKTSSIVKITLKGKSESGSEGGDGTFLKFYFTFRNLLALKNISTQTYICLEECSDVTYYQEGGNEAAYTGSFIDPDKVYYIEFSTLDESTSIQSIPTDYIYSGLPWNAAGQYIAATLDLTILDLLRFINTYKNYGSATTPDGLVAVVTVYLIEMPNAPLNKIPTSPTNPHKFGYSHYNTNGMTAFNNLS